MKPDSYFRYLFQKAQFLDWVVLIVTVAVGCLLVTWSYPYPGTISDSFGYLAAAIGKNYLAYRPFGYSGFLQAIHLVSKSIYSIVVSQAIIYIFSLGLFLLAVKKYYPPRHRGWFWAFIVLVAGSPTALFLLDTILSDVLFCCLIFVLLAMMMVMIKERSWLALGLYGLAFFAALHTRYGAMFFLFAFLPIFAFIKKPRFYRLSAIALTLAIFGVFVLQVEHNMRHEIGKWQFSTGFDGWQLSNNALHVLPFLDEEELKEIPEDDMLQSIHSYCLGFRPALREATNDGKDVTAVFLWGNDYPLKQMTFAYMQASRKTYYECWILVGSTYYKQYGRWVISHFPGKFFRYFLLPNFRRVFFPKELEVICSYENVEAGKNVIVDWFDFDNTALTPRNEQYSRVFAPMLPWIDLLTWVIFLAGAVVLLVSRRWRAPLPGDTRLVLWMLFLFGCVYYGSTVFASPIVIRYWMPMHAVKLYFAWIAFRCAEKSVSLHS